MADIDTSKRKPRRTRGTPSYYYRNRVAAGIIATGTLIFAAFAQTSMFKKLIEGIERDFLPVTEEQIDRKKLFSFIKQRRGEEILKIMEEEKNLRIER